MGGYVAPGNRAPDEVYSTLQSLADAGYIKLVTAWCSEIGTFSTDDPGHFHGQGAIHLAETFAMVPPPGEGVTCEMPPPIEIKIPLRSKEN